MIAVFNFLADPPANVHLNTNTTSKVCAGVVINFTCTVEANPAVHTFLLYENGAVIRNMGISGTWIKTMKNADQYVETEHRKAASMCSDVRQIILSKGLEKVMILS